MINYMVTLAVMVGRFREKKLKSSPSPSESRSRAVSYLWEKAGRGEGGDTKLNATFRDLKDSKVVCLA